MVTFFLPALFGVTAAATLITSRSGSEAECYFPNGSLTPGQFPCTNSTTTTVCCANGFQCASNGLCVDYRYPNFSRIVRGGCTDKNWGPGCLGVCKDAWADREEAVFYCGNGKYCCDGDDCCQRAGANILELGDPVIVAIARNPSEPAAPGTFSTMRLSVTPSATSNPSTQSPTTTTATAPASKSSTNATAIGAGVGVGAGIVLVAIVVGFFILRSRKRKAAKAPDHAQRSVAAHPDPSYYRAEADAYGHSDKLHELPTFSDPTEVDGYGNEVRKYDVPVTDARQKDIYAPLGRGRG